MVISFSKKAVRCSDISIPDEITADFAVGSNSTFLGRFVNPIFRRGVRMVADDRLDLPNNIEQMLENVGLAFSFRPHELVSHAIYPTEMNRTLMVQFIWRSCVPLVYCDKYGKRNGGVQFTFTTLTMIWP
jgi:hypothetical protein